MDEPSAAAAGDRRAAIIDEVIRILTQEIERASSGDGGDGGDGAGWPGTGGAPPPADIGEGTALRAVPGLDSVGIVVLVVGLEDRFRVKLTDIEPETVETVGDLVNVVERAIDGERRAKRC